jgi:hypothetical protein
MPQLGSRERWCSPRRNLPARGGGNGILSRAPAAIATTGDTGRSRATSRAARQLAPPTWRRRDLLA